MKTLADLRRDAAGGKIKLELLERYGETGEAIPERCRGVRSVQKVNTVGMTLMTADGKTSELRFGSAKTVAYDGESLTIYERGERDLTDQEKQILADWERVQAEHLAQNPHSDAYWKKKDYFAKCPCPWLASWETVSGKRLMHNGKVQDNQVRGEAILRYKVHRSTVEISHAG